MAVSATAKRKAHPTTALLRFAFNLFYSWRDVSFVDVAVVPAVAVLIVGEVFMYLEHDLVLVVVVHAALGMLVMLHGCVDVVAHAVADC